MKTRLTPRACRHLVVAWPVFCGLMVGGLLGALTGSWTVGVFFLVATVLGTMAAVHGQIKRRGIDHASLVGQSSLDWSPASDEDDPMLAASDLDHQFKGYL